MSQEVQDAHADELSERLIFPATKAMAEAIADYRFEQRIESKADAIRRLIEAGLRVESKKPKSKSA